ncbi:tryptase beta-2-like [Portunus trituberculatus]|uniref:tryptase beta-2-like n=1 Tax=Portunus trituberculatus TaxID=210409 RepID=UPI001E1D10C8|nr:tryptase beta-2-like [Portunus trituberculatus]
MTYLSVESAIIHEDYNDLRIDDGDDVALIKLSNLLNFQNNPSVQPVCLAEAEDLMIGQDLVNSGWGNIIPSRNNSSPNELYEVSLTHVDLEICSYFEDVPRDRQKVLCTLNANKSSCYGDSGGPLVVQLCDGRWVQAGVVSYGTEDCTGVVLFTSVPYYKDWIIRNIEKPIYIC